MCLDQTMEARECNTGCMRPIENDSMYINDILVDMTYATCTPVLPDSPKTRSIRVPGIHSF